MAFLGALRTHSCVIVIEACVVSLLPLLKGLVMVLCQFQDILIDSPDRLKRFAKGSIWGILSSCNVEGVR